MSAHPAPSPRSRFELRLRPRACEPASPEVPAGDNAAADADISPPAAVPRSLLPDVSYHDQLFRTWENQADVMREADLAILDLNRRPLPIGRRRAGRRREPVS